MVRQPYMGLGLLFPRLRGLCAFAAVRDRPTAVKFRNIGLNYIRSQFLFSVGHIWLLNCELVYPVNQHLIVR
jgi:hypothetical protein